MVSLPQPGAMVSLSLAHRPALMQGLVVSPQNPLQFDFLIDQGQAGLSPAAKQQQYTQLVKYFLAALTIPEKDQWVNLSPYEKNRILPDNFGQTEMGRDLLAQDYVLKQLTSSLMYPESGLGKIFWERVYSEADSKVIRQVVALSAFNKVWIVPDEAAVYESGNTVYVLRNHLKVMLEEDYQALANNERSHPSHASAASRAIKELILPELEREVNEGKNFAVLRQVYSAMILATWYKRALRQSLLGQVYANQAKTDGINQDPKNNQAIYEQYLAALKKGVFDYIREDRDAQNRPFPRKYFAGGMVSFSMTVPNARRFQDGAVVVLNNAATVAPEIRQRIKPPSHTGVSLDRAQFHFQKALQRPPADAAMLFQIKPKTGPQPKTVELTPKTEAPDDKRADENQEEYDDDIYRPAGVSAISRKTYHQYIPTVFDTWGNSRVRFSPTPETIKLSQYILEEWQLDGPPKVIARPIRIVAKQHLSAISEEHIKKLLVEKSRERPSVLQLLSATHFRYTVPITELIEKLEQGIEDESRWEQDKIEVFNDGMDERVMMKLKRLALPLSRLLKAAPHTKDIIDKMNQKSYWAKPVKDYDQVGRLSDTVFADQKGLASIVDPKDFPAVWRVIQGTKDQHEIWLNANGEVMLTQNQALLRTVNFSEQSPETTESSLHHSRFMDEVKDLFLSIGAWATTESSLARAVKRASGSFTYDFPSPDFVPRVLNGSTLVGDSRDPSSYMQAKASIRFDPTTIKAIELPEKAVLVPLRADLGRIQGVLVDPKTGFIFKYISDKEYDWVEPPQAILDEIYLKLALAVRFDNEIVDILDDLWDHWKERFALSSVHPTIDDVIQVGVDLLKQASSRMKRGLLIIADGRKETFYGSLSGHSYVLSDWNRVRKYTVSDGYPDRDLLQIKEDLKTILNHKLETGGPIQLKLEFSDQHEVALVLAPKAAVIIEPADPAMAAPAKGGIDMDPSQLKLRVAGSSADRAQTTPVAGIAQWRGIQGLVPVLDHIVPVRGDLPLFAEIHRTLEL